MLAASVALAASKTEGYVTKLCDATVVALQKTDAAPVAALFSAQTSSFLVAQGDKVLHVGRARLLKMEKWGDKPAFTEKAKVADIKLTDRAYAVRVVANVEDGDAKYILDGVSTREGEGHKWLMLAVVPAAPEPSKAETDEFKGKLAAMFGAWQTGLAAGNGGPMLATMAPDDVAVCVVGPDYGFYTFATRGEFEAALQQVAAVGGVKITGLETLTGTLRGPVAAQWGTWSLSVAMMQPATQDLWAHLYLDHGEWRVAGLCAMPTEQ
jgi:hypothetical protein